METIDWKEWKKIKEKNDSRKKFYELFNVTCKKCGSSNIEFFGEIDNSACYYSGETGDLDIVMKCHACGNAKVFEESLESLDGEILSLK